MKLEEIRKKIREFPSTPGVYVIKNAAGKTIYIGKARSLRARLSSHFRLGGSTEPMKGHLLRRDARDIELLHTASEAEALLLEASLVKQENPPYNVDLKDDKSYPFLKVTMEEEFPRLLVVRGRKSDGALYFGPFTEVRLLKEAVSFLRRLFPLRTCKTLPDRVCLMYHIGQCAGPCAGEVDKESYRETVKELVLFLEGKKSTLVKQLEKRMKEAAANRRYEDARLFRDQIQALSTVSILRSPMSRLGTLDEMMTSLGLKRYPRRIEGFDISNFSGKKTVASMVVFEDGAPKKSDYRHFKIKTVEGIDDYASMREVVRRRYARLLAEKGELPDLIVIDGGKGHLAAAKLVLDELNLSDRDLISIAKQHEYVFKPDRPTPYIFPQDSALLQILRYLRDEAHRFAIGHYRKLHRKEMQWSALDEIRGIGGKRKTQILRSFKSVTELQGKTAEELMAVSGVDRKTAKNIEEYFKTR